MNSKISVILPAYNEEGAVGAVIDETIAVMRQGQYDFEIVVVDDASTDRTAEIAGTKDVRLIRHTSNRGVGAARKSGILNCSGEIVVMLDTDGTYPVRSIPELLRHIPEYDQVIGSRTNEQGPLHILRWTTKWLLFKLASCLMREDIPDLNSGMRALKKDIVSKYLDLIPDGFSCVSTMTMAFLCHGHKVKYVPIQYHPRIGKSKFRICSDTGVVLLTILKWARFSLAGRRQCFLKK
jgi:glycosyltransferase involved in cell wall biosynthesis